MTNDFNVAKVPSNLSANTGAAIGVAFVSAVLALGVSLGVNFANTLKAPQGPDFQSILNHISRDQVPHDVQRECFDSISSKEQPTHGDWVAIWGGKCGDHPMHV